MASIPNNPADHAKDFARRYAADLDIAAGELLMGIGIDSARLGAIDPEDLVDNKFHPAERTVGSLTPDGRITLDSGIMHPDALDERYRRDAGGTGRRVEVEGCALTVVPVPPSEPSPHEHRPRSKVG